jgi:dolichol kinase
MRQDVAVSLGRIAWSITFAICVIAAICLFFSDYTGYGVLALAVGASAAINLR